MSFRRYSSEQWSVGQ